MGEFPMVGSQDIVATGPDTFILAGCRFRCVSTDYDRYETSSEEVILLKRPNFLRLYDDIFANIPTSNVLELGVFQGGSLIYFGLAFPHLRFVGVDWTPLRNNVLRVVDELGLSERIRIHYGVGQNNAFLLERIVRQDFHGQVGAVIDDASHRYDLSRRSMEILFPMLPSGGVFCLEDWTSPTKKGEVPLSKLISDMVEVVRENPAACTGIVVRHQMAAFTRGVGSFHGELTLPSATRLLGTTGRDGIA